jgi:integrase
MALRKRCGEQPRTLPGGAENPFYCGTSPRCEHHWHYDFQMNGRRYRASTETSDKHKARDIEAKERSRILDGRHGIRRQPDITFRQFTETYLRDHSALHKRDKGARDREIIALLNRTFGPLILHEITAHRIEQWKRERLEGRWTAHRQKRRPKPVKPATVNRELDTLRGILSKAVEWGKLHESPARTVRRLKVDNRRTRILTADEEIRLVNACHGKFRTMVALALLTGARRGELLTLTWENVTDTEIVFLETKNGRPRRIPLSPAIRELLKPLPRVRPWVFTNVRTGQPYTTVGKNFERALERAGIRTGDVSFHTLRHTALSRMIAEGHSDHTVRAISGHSTTRMLERYTHPTEVLKVSALETGSYLVTTASQPDNDEWKKYGGRQGDRTHDLRIANGSKTKP